MHYASIIEAIADRLPETEALVHHGGVRRSWAAYDERAARLASAFAAAGLRTGATVSLFLYNCAEYLEVQLAALKQRMTPVNINYRYVDAEVAYLLENSDSEGLVFHGSLGDTVARVAPRMPRLRLLLQVDDGVPLLPQAVAYEDALASHAPAARLERRPDDLFMMYTGGTTGMPKGVMYDIGDISAAFANLYPQVLLGRPPVSSDAEAADFAAGMHKTGQAWTFLPASPLMHTAGLFQSMALQLLGAKIVTLPQRTFDARGLWQAVQDERVTGMVIVGDAFARPMIDALRAAQAEGTPYDVSSLRLILSSGVMWSAEVKQALLEFGDFMLIDGIGATEGAMGYQITRRGTQAATGTFMKAADTRLFTEDGREITPGSDEAGLIAAGGALVPRGYYKDPEKSAKTFRVVAGKRYAFTGDWGKLAADGSLILLGRGSTCINTAGEKVFPEEVEEILKAHPQVEDCLVVGIPDERFGQRVAAVVATSAGGEDVAGELTAFCKDQMAGYKRPRLFVRVDAIARLASGKPDYGWARERLLEAAAAEAGTGAR
jgi:acyl-CoA synthetase (AMP-forming)/AMP-acid ligase II